MRATNTASTRKLSYRRGMTTSMPSGSQTGVLFLFHIESRCSYEYVSKLLLLASGISTSSGGHKMLELVYVPNDSIAIAVFDSALPAVCAMEVLNGVTLFGQTIYAHVDRKTLALIDMWHYQKSKLLAHTIVGSGYDAPGNLSDMVELELVEHVSKLHREVVEHIRLTESVEATNFDLSDAERLQKMQDSRIARALVEKAEEGSAVDRMKSELEALIAEYMVVEKQMDDQDRRLELEQLARQSQDHVLPEKSIGVSIEEVIRQLPRTRDEILNFPINREYLHSNLLRAASPMSPDSSPTTTNKHFVGARARVFRESIETLVRDVLGSDDAEFTAYTYRKLASSVEPLDLLAELRPALDDESERFVMALWITLIYETVRHDSIQSQLAALKSKESCFASLQVESSQSEMVLLDGIENLIGCSPATEAEGIAIWKCISKRISEQC